MKHERPLIVFDVNETLLDLETLVPTFERIFGDQSAMRLWFANLIMYSEALTLAGVYVPFTEIGGAVLKMLATARGAVISEETAAELTDQFASMPPHPEVAGALRRLPDHGFRLFTLTDNTLEISGRQLEHGEVIDLFERRSREDMSERSAIHHRYATVGAQRLFYREAGPTDAPIVLLLHGFPTSSFLFRSLIPTLSDRYHLIAADHLGFGLSDAPSVDEFTYSFDALAELTAGLLHKLGVERYAMYVQDYGAPVGWRLALANAGSITAIITQDGNGYEAGFVDAFWEPVREYWHDENAGTEAALRQALTLDAIRWQYLHGVPTRLW
jgi:2-haloalkanoic acid dehalogenase type II